MLYANDEWLIGQTVRYEVDLLLHIFILVIINAPVAWHKVCGGIETDWVGYYLQAGRWTGSKTRRGSGEYNSRSCEKVFPDCSS